MKDKKSIESMSEFKEYVKNEKDDLKNTIEDSWSDFKNPIKQGVLNIGDSFKDCVEDSKYWLEDRLDDIDSYISFRKNEKEIEKRRIAETCKKYKEQLGDKPLNYFKTQYELAQKALADAETIYESRFTELVEQFADKNEIALKYKRKYSKKTNLGCALSLTIFILGILAFFAEMSPITEILIFVGIIWGASCLSGKEKLKEELTKIFIEADTTFKKYAEDKDLAEKEKKHWSEYMEKVLYIEKHEKETKV